MSAHTSSQGESGDGRSGVAPGDLGRHWIEQPETVRKIVYLLYALCAVLLVVDPLIHKHGPFAIEHVWGFYGLYGFIGCVFLVVAAKAMRVVLMRAESYYDR